MNATEQSVVDAATAINMEASLVSLNEFLLPNWLGLCRHMVQHLKKI